MSRPAAGTTTGDAAHPLTIDLAGRWSVREALGLSWQWYVGAPPPQTGNNAATAAEALERTPGWLPASVPGAVIADLHAAGEIADPYVGRNSKAAEWVADRSWVYRRDVELPARPAGERAVLEFEGVDPGATVFLDGVELATVFGLYRRHRIDITGLATPGTHTLSVVVHPAPESEPQVGRTELVRWHTPRMGYGWDFCPRLRHQGIWRPVRIHFGAVLLTDAAVRGELDETLSHGLVRIVGTTTPGGTVAAELRRPGRTVASGTAASGEELTLAVESPELWWPAGLGEQTLYTVTVRAIGPAEADELEVGGNTAAGRTPADAVQREFSVGFRNLRFVQNSGAEPSALPYTAVVNGHPLPLVGWNWAPADALYGTITPARVKHLVGMAARSGARILRVWGGGLIETPEFYDACDRAGMLVWQEFSQSSSGMQSAPATDDDFVALMRSEAEAIVPTRTHHASLAIWGGGNELDEGGTPLDETRSPVLAALREVVQRLDPGRHWLPTSPSGPVFHNRLGQASANQHDVHGPWEHQGLVDQHTLSNQGASLAHTEFGVEGMTNLRSLEALIPAADRWPADRGNPVYRHLGEWWNNAELVQRSFGGRLDTLARMQRASQLLQATGLAYEVEADRRRWPHCSMVLPWQLAESYPNAWCTAAVDYRGDAKPAYFAVARAFARTRVTLRTARSVFGGEPVVRAEAWVWSEQPVSAGSTVTVRLLDAFGARLGEQRAELPAVADPAAALAVEFAQLESAVFAWELEWRAASGDLLDHEVVLAASGDDWSAMLDLPTATLEVEVDGSGDDRLVRIRHRSGPIVVGLRLVDARPASAAGWAVLEGDPRPLLPGGHREFAVHWEDAGADRALALESWNTETVELR